MAERKVRFEMTERATFRQVSEACRILGADVDAVLENPYEALDPVHMQPSQVIPFIEAVCVDIDPADLELVADMPPEALLREGEKVAMSFFLTAWLERLHDQGQGTQPSSKTDPRLIAA